MLVFFFKTDDGLSPASVVQVTSDTTHYLSTVHVKSAVMTVDEFLDPHLDNRLHVLRSDVNASVTVFIAVSRTDAELIMSQVFCLLVNCFILKPL